jgi:hypothetical protein
MKKTGDKMADWWEKLLDVLEDRITYEMLVDPFVTLCGHTFGRANAEKWGLQNLRSSYGLSDKRSIGKSNAVFQQKQCPTCHEDIGVVSTFVINQALELLCATVRAKKKKPNVSDLKDVFKKATLCQLTRKVMYTPVTTRCGHNFDKKAIEEHLRTHSTCPCCNKKLDRKTFNKNIVINNIIPIFLVAYYSKYPQEINKTIFSGERTYLHYVVEKSSPAELDVLLRINGINPFVADSRQENPLGLADRTNKQQKIMKITSYIINNARLSSYWFSYLSLLIKRIEKKYKEKKHHKYLFINGKKSPETKAVLEKMKATKSIAVMIATAKGYMNVRSNGKRDLYAVLVENWRPYACRKKHSTKKVVGRLRHR